MLRHSFLVLALALLQLSLSCQQPERWTAIVYPGQTAFNLRTVGEYENVQSCLIEGKVHAGEGFLECGLNCRWDAQGLFTCEKIVRLMEHQAPR